MEIAVWDTYVEQASGEVLHFDILVAAGLNDPAAVYRYGKEYLASIGSEGKELTTEQCRFCHVEEPGEDVVRAVRTQGYYILRMDDIPARLPPDAGRRDLALHLRGHYPAFRFGDLRGLSADDLREIISKIEDGK